MSRRRFVVGGGVALVASAAAPAALARPRRSKTSMLPDAKAVAALGRDPADLDALECAALLQARMLSPVELLAACRTRIERRNGGPPTFGGAPDAINAWVRLYDDLAEESARAAERRLSRGEVRRRGRAAPLVCGIPVGLKDLFAVAGKPLTASSHVLDGNIAPGDSTVWTRLRSAGMVLVGHTHMHEFAMGATTDQTGNPWDLRRSPGGSSGGSAAALAARMVPATTGSDTGGSLRMPSSVCGTSAIKPTLGRVSTYGTIPWGFTLDHTGPMARSVGGCSLLLGYMVGPDVEDPATLGYAKPPEPYPLRARPGARPLAGTRLGVPRARIAAANVESGVTERFEAFLAECRALGAELVDVAMPDGAQNAVTDILSVVLPEMQLYHEQFADRIGRYRPAQQELVVASQAPIPATVYLRAQRARTELAEACNDLFASKRLDAIIEPTTPIVAPVRGPENDAVALLGGGTGITLGGLTVLWDLTGLPVVAIPAGLTADSRLPCGASLIAPVGQESQIVQIGIDLQSHYPHHELTPPGLA